MYAEEDFLMLSGIQHFAFCRRQWALIHIEQQWEENVRTVDGQLFHKTAHNAEKTEKRGALLITRGLHVKSEKLGVAGICDVVEFHKDENGVTLSKYDGTWKPYPVEYKRGAPKEGMADELQLCCQAMCLEEMLACEITSGSLFYGENRRRTQVEFSETLRQTVRDMLAEMHEYMKKGHTPKVKPKKGCNACSLKDKCLPKLGKTKDVNAYIQERLMGD